MVSCLLCVAMHLPVDLLNSYGQIWMMSTAAALPASLEVHSGPVSSSTLDATRPAIGWPGYDGVRSVATSLDPAVQETG